MYPLYAELREPTCGAWTLASSLDTCPWRIQKARLDAHLTFEHGMMPFGSCASSGRSRGEYAVHYMHKRTLLCSIDHSWNAAFSMVKQLPKGQSKLEIMSRNFYLSTPLLCKKQKQSELEAIDAMAKFRF
jgi:hypothetical protein